MPALFNYIIDEMTDAVRDAIMAYPGPDDGSELKTPREVIKAALEACWADRGAIVWTTEDILDEFPKLTADEARDVLYELVHNHDASRGVRWDNLSGFVYAVVPDYDKREDEEDDDKEECS
jgi:hypothetical protein